MPAQTPCERCGTVGFVRREHVIEKGKALTRFYCGHCNQTWEVVETPGTEENIPADTNHRDEPPDHSR
jgi:hypothetical protein